jgi:hypothetical protein
MRVGRRYGLSSAQKTESGAVGRRESRYMRSAVLSARTMADPFLVIAHGGIVPAVRLRSERTPTPAEREEISRGLA